LHLNYAFNVVNCLLLLLLLLLLSLLLVVSFLRSLRMLYKN